VGSVNPFLTVPNYAVPDRPYAGSGIRARDKLLPTTAIQAVTLISSFSL
jgi:hypothetical protein